MEGIAKQRVIVRHERGLTMYQYDLVKKEMSLCRFDYDVTNGKEKMIVEENHIYCASLNEKNARRKFAQMVNEQQ